MAEEISNDMAEEIKRERKIAKGLFTRAKNSLVRAIEGKHDVELVERRFGELRQRWNEVQQKHVHFLSLQEDDESALQDEEEWMDLVEQEFENAESLHLEFTREHKSSPISTVASNNAKDSEAINKAHQVRKMEEAIFKKHFENMNSLIQKESKQPSSLIEAIKESQDELRNLFQSCRKAQTKFIQLLPQEDADSQCSWLEQLHDMMSEMNIKICSVINARKEAADENKKNSMRLERMKMPTFQGDVRDYPRFKSDFNEQVVPHVGGDKNAAYALKSCLSKVAYDLVKNVDNDIAEMWRRLDDKYGKPSKLVDVIMYDIKKLKMVREGEEKSFIDLVDVIERGYQDLCRLKLEKEMSNNTIVSLIEQKLPRDIAKDWAKEVNKAGSSVDDGNKFPSLLQFLLEQKRIIEYQMDDFRSSASNIGKARHIDVKESTQLSEEDQPVRPKRCLLHKGSNHSTEECKAFLEMLPADKIQLVRDNRACFSCLKVGHRAWDCRGKKKCSHDGCDRHHHESLHEAHANGTVFHTRNDKDSKRHYHDACLLQLMQIEAGIEHKLPVTVLWDGGATISLITFDMAERLELNGEDVKITVTKVGGVQEDMSSKVYHLPLLDREGKAVEFKVYGIDKISTEVDGIDDILIQWG